jgi:hypothetical protein
MTDRERKRVIEELRYQRRDLSRYREQDTEYTRSLAKYTESRCKDLERELEER